MTNSLLASTRMTLESAQRATAIAAMHCAEELVASRGGRKPSRRARDLASAYVGAKQREAEAWARYRSALDHAASVGGAA